MYRVNTLYLSDLTVEHLQKPLGIDSASPRFAWKLHSSQKNTVQTSCRIVIRKDDGTICTDSGEIITSESTEITVDGFRPEPKTAYIAEVTVKDNHGRSASIVSSFETARMGEPFQGKWAEPVQEPTPSTMDLNRSGDTYDAVMRDENGNRTFEEFRPCQYIRIPFTAKKGIRKARVYATAHGLYQLSINGSKADDRLFAPENTAYNKHLLYQTYDITSLLTEGENVIGVILADGWWAGRVGTTGDCCQYGNTTALLLNAEIEYMDSSRQVIAGDEGVSSTGPLIFSDLFVGEKYDASKEMNGWDMPGFDDSSWLPVLGKDYDRDHLYAQSFAPVRICQSFMPQNIYTAPNSDIIIDAGQNVAGVTEFTVTAPAGIEIRLEHFETTDRDGNYFNSILNTNKEQTDIYITREGTQTWRPSFTYHGFRYIRVSGWPGEISVNQFRIIVYASAMEDLGSFETSDERLNQLQSNILYSQIANTISIPTDCPQREKAGWTGDIMAYAPTMCFLRDADAFLTSWMDSVRAEQLESGAVPMIVPYLKAYATFLKDALGTDTSAGWGDAAIIVPYRVYQAYGDRRILEENYDTMVRWMKYIADRAQNHHPEGYETWDEERKARSRLLWNTDFHFGDWLIPSIVLGNPDAMAMNQTAYATMGIVAPAYYAFSAKIMSEIAAILNRDDDAAAYAELYENIRNAFIAEYVREDGTFEADFQGIYVIALQMGLVSEELRPKMIQHLIDLIKDNGNRLDTGFLSVLFLMDVLCDNECSDTAYRLLYQTACPGWLYEVNTGATTMWESWGAVSEDGTVSTYSYNHYAFGCVGDWMYRRIGGLVPLKPGYRSFRVSPDFSCGLDYTSVSEETPYGKAAVEWHKCSDHAFVHVSVPVNTTAEIVLPGIEPVTIGSGEYDYLVNLKDF